MIRWICVAAALIAIGAFVAASINADMKPARQWDGKAELIQMPGEDNMGRDLPNARCVRRIIYPSPGRRIFYAFHLVTMPDCSTKPKEEPSP